MRGLHPSSPDSSSQYQAMLTPTQTAQEFELLVEGVVRGPSHSHALSAILGANTRDSTSLSTLLDWRPSSQVQLHANSSTSVQVTGNIKSEFLWMVPYWKQWRRRWNKVVFWSIALVIFTASFVLTFAFPKQVATFLPLVLGSGLSLLSTVIIFGSFLKRRRLQKRPNDCLAYVALSDFGFAILTLVHVMIMCNATNGECRSLVMIPCTISISVDLFLLLTGIGWFGAAILHLFVSISNPFANHKRQLILYHVVVWGGSVLASTILPFSLFSEYTQEKYQLTNTELCRIVSLVFPLLPTDAIKSKSMKRHRIAQWQDLNLAFYGIVGGTVILIIFAAQLGLFISWWRSNSGTIIALKARRRLLKRMTIYVHAFTSMWIVLIAIFFIYRTNIQALEEIQVNDSNVPNDAKMNILRLCFHFLVTGKGFVTSIVWLSVNKPCCVLELVSCGLHHCTNNDEDASLDHSASLSASSSDSYTRNYTETTCTTRVPYENGHVVQEPIISPTFYDTGTHDVLQSQDQPSFPTFDQISRLSRLSASYETSTIESYEASQSHEILQREIIYYTVCGITKAIIRAAERANVRSSEVIETRATLNDCENGIETTLFVDDQDHHSVLSNVQNVPPRRYCVPRVPHSITPSHSLDAFDEEVQRSSHLLPRPTSFSCVSRRDSTSFRSSQETFQSNLLVETRPCLINSQSRSRNSLYPVSQVPFELFEQEIELQSTRSSSDEPIEETSTRSAVFAGFRRTATSAFNQRRGGYRGRSKSSGSEIFQSWISREMIPDEIKPKVFVDYAPRAFRAIRLAFQLSDEKYLASFRTTAKERVSSGSSGAFMFFSGDKSLLVKSLKEKECRALVHMAPAYARYLTGNPHSRLIRFFGCHRVRLYGRNFYFAVMSNVLHSEGHTSMILEKYDVKGSWVNRQARRPQSGDRVTCAECDASYIFDNGDEISSVIDNQDGCNSIETSTFPFHIHRPDIVFKDLDLKRTLQLPRHIAMHLHTQLRSDCEFLRDRGIMDYSLLIGIHKCHSRSQSLNERNDSIEIEASIHHCEDINSGMNLAPLGEKEIYFIGIIDILQEWDWEKQFEKAGKVLLGKCARGISAIAPTAYCRRFQARCTQILLGGPAPETLDPNWDEMDLNGREKSRLNSKNVKEMAVLT